MDILLGVGTLSATVLLFSWAFGAHRRPDRAAWVSWPGASMLVCVALTLLAPVGLGFIIRGALHPLTDLTRITVLEAVCVAGLLFLAVTVSPFLIRPGLRRGTVVRDTADTGNFAPV